jgi:hypothetical protein
MQKITFLGLARKVLIEEKRPPSPGEIWKIAAAKGYTSGLDSQGKTPAMTLYSSVYLDARDNPESDFFKLGARPARYFLKSLAQGPDYSQLEKSAASNAVAVPEMHEFDESDLHPLLVRFAYVRFNAFSKTIKHAKSRRREFSEWVHTDIVAVYFPVDDWASAVYDLSVATGNVAVRLYSFEIKKSLSFQNLREAFFQAVSNSSWAHEGYLAAADIAEEDQDFMRELRRLSASFGIGVVRLSREDPDSSDVLIPARQRDTLDWDTLNKLAQMNADVEDLLSRVKNDLTTKEVIKEKYDEILALDGLLTAARRKANPRRDAGKAERKG